MAGEIDWMIMAHNGGSGVVQPQPTHTYDLFNRTVKESLV